MSLPRITEVGRLTQDPELRFTSSGKAVCNINVAFNKRRKNQQTGEWEDAGVLYVRGAVWDQAGENVAESLTKGMEVMVAGELSQREYERQDGSKGWSLEMQVFAIGPTLRYQTAKVNKVARGSSDFGGGGQGPVDDPWTAGSPAAAGGFSEEPPF